MSEVKTTAKEDKLMELFANYFVEVVLSDQLKISDEVDEVEMTVTEQFLKDLRKILNGKD